MVIIEKKCVTGDELVALCVIEMSARHVRPYLLTCVNQKRVQEAIHSSAILDRLR